MLNRPASLSRRVRFVPPEQNGATAVLGMPPRSRAVFGRRRERGCAAISLGASKPFARTGVPRYSDFDQAAATTTVQPLPAGVCAGQGVIEPSPGLTLPTSECCNARPVCISWRRAREWHAARGATGRWVWNFVTIGTLVFSSPPAARRRVPWSRLLPQRQTVRSRCSLSPRRQPQPSCGPLSFAI